MTTYVQSRCIPNAITENTTRATGVAININNPNWISPCECNAKASDTMPGTWVNSLGSPANT